MKKLLATMLSILLLFGVFAVGAQAFWKRPAWRFPR